MGIEFNHPSSWILSRDETDEQKCEYDCSVSFDISDTGIVPVIVHKYDLNNPLIQSECICNTLKDFVKWVYENDFVTKAINLNRDVISDSPVTINNTLSGWEMESKFEVGLTGKIRQNYNFWILHDDVGYFISYPADEGMQFQKYLPEIKNMIQTIKFIPIEIPQKNVPSFLQ